MKTIENIYQKALCEICKNEEEWMKFLSFSSKFYKGYNFSEQVLIYYQNPNAVACATFDQWNNEIHRKIKKFSKGIYVGKDENGKNRYVYDISDTYQDPEKSERKIYHWVLKNEHLPTIQKQIKEIIDVDKTLSQQINDIVLLKVIKISDDNTVKEFIRNFKEKDKETVKGLLEDFIYKSSVYTIKARCGLTNTVRKDDFINLSFFSKPDELIYIGTLSQMISEEILTKIGMTIRHYDYKKYAQIERKKSEKDFLEERNPISIEGGLLDSENRDRNQFESVWKNDPAVYANRKKTTIQPDDVSRNIGCISGENTKLISQNREKVSSGSGNERIRETTIWKNVDGRITETVRRNGSKKTCRINIEI